jgi:predicted CoA-binding protein
LHDTGAECKGEIFNVILKMEKKTLVIGASKNPARYSYLAVQKLAQHNHPVIALGKNNGTIGDVAIETEKEQLNDIDTVTLYLNPNNQKEYYDYILSLNPKRIIFNPGAENNELEELAQQKGIKTMEACTLVLLSTGQY